MICIRYLKNIPAKTWYKHLICSALTALLGWICWGWTNRIIYSASGFTLHWEVQSLVYQFFARDILFSIGNSSPNFTGAVLSAWILIGYSSDKPQVGYWAIVASKINFLLRFWNKILLTWVATNKNNYSASIASNLFASFLVY